MNRIEQLVVEQQFRQQLAYANIEVIRAAAGLVTQFFETTPNLDSWSMWMGWEGRVCLHSSMFAQTSIMHDSVVAEELEHLEAFFSGEFTSSVDPDDGTIHYKMEVPNIQVTINVYLLESGACRKVVVGYETVQKNVSIETAQPVYGIICS